MFLLAETLRRNRHDRSKRIVEAVAQLIEQCLLTFFGLFVLSVRSRTKKQRRLLQPYRTEPRQSRPECGCRPCGQNSIRKACKLRCPQALAAPGTLWAATRASPSRPQLTCPKAGRRGHIPPWKRHCWPGRSGHPKSKWQCRWMLASIDLRTLPLPVL